MPFFLRRNLIASVVVVIFTSHINLTPIASAQEMERVRDTALLLALEQAVEKYNSAASVEDLISLLPPHLQGIVKQEFYRLVPGNFAVETFPDVREWVPAVYEMAFDYGASSVLGYWGSRIFKKGVKKVVREGYWKVVRPAKTVLTDQIKSSVDLVLPSLSLLPKARQEENEIRWDEAVFELVQKEGELALQFSENGATIDLRDAGNRLSDPALAAAYLIELRRLLEGEKTGALQRLFSFPNAYAISLFALAIIAVIFIVILTRTIWLVSPEVHMRHDLKNKFETGILLPRLSYSESNFQAMIVEFDEVVEHGKYNLSGERWRNAITDLCHEHLQCTVPYPSGEDSLEIARRLLMVLGRYSTDPNSIPIIERLERYQEEWAPLAVRESLRPMTHNARVEIERRIKSED